MTKIIVYLTKLFLAVAIALLFGSCKYDLDFGNGIDGNGNERTETRDSKENFTGIEVSRGIQLEVEQSNSKSITVIADDNLQQYITTEINNGVLEVTTSEQIADASSIRVIVKMPVITNLQASSAAEITSNSVITSGNLALATSSGSEMDLTLEAESLTAESSSGSSMTLKGKALKIDMKTSSGSNIEAEQLLANEIVVRSSSGSSADVNPIVNLDAHASSGSSIDYHNTPKNVSQQSSSGGSVSKI